MNNIKRVNEFFGGDKNDDDFLEQAFMNSTNVAQDEIHKAVDFVHEIEDYVKNKEQMGGFRNHTLPHLRKLASIVRNNPDILDTLKKLSEINDDEFERIFN